MYLYVIEVVNILFTLYNCLKFNFLSYIGLFLKVGEFLCFHFLFTQCLLKKKTKFKVAFVLSVRCFLYTFDLNH
ncbi:hypothetical protein CLU99_1711 [Flavobacterium sp. 2]|nr:hypothetical protein CLU99_1711 [Flavobacterium sp. 2]